MIASLLIATACLGQFGGSSGAGNGGPVIVSSPGLSGTSPLGAGPGPAFAIPDAIKFAVVGGIPTNGQTYLVPVALGSLPCVIPRIASRIVTQAERNYYLKVFIENPE